jgi:glucose/arabinose dehydrogenase
MKSIFRRTMFSVCLLRVLRAPASLCVVLAVVVNGFAHAQTIPRQFAMSTVANVGGATALAMTPDGRLLVATQSGSLRVVKNGQLLATAALTLGTSAICTESERGLLGVAVDPNFATNNYVYLFYTARNGSSCETGFTYGTASTYNPTNRPVNRVSRFSLGNNDVIPPASELVIVNNMPSPGGNHNAGDIHFGKDGMLYISIGDGGSDYASPSSGAGGANDAARDINVLTGKILRVNPNDPASNFIPADNPFSASEANVCGSSGATSDTTKHCRETYAWGLRNPFRFAMDSNASGTRFYINEVGQDLWEEVNESAPRTDYGWNACEGRHNTGTSSATCTNAPSGSVLPIYEYKHGLAGVPGTTLNNCGSITGGAFVPNGLWPGYDNRYIVADLNCSSMWTIPADGTPSNPVISGSLFVFSAGAPTTIAFAPFGAGKALYVAGYGIDSVFAIYYKSAALDVDGNGMPDAATDGVLIVRYMLGYRGAELVAGALGSGATRNVAQIENYLAGKTAGAAAPFKISAGGTTAQAMSDGLLIVRHLLGFTGAALTNGVPLAAPLNNATSIGNYLLTLSPI